jgi:hypothetical protein
MRGEVVGINTLYLEGGDIEWRARRALPGLLVRPSGTLHTDWLIFVFVLVVIIPAHSFKAMGDGSSAAGVVLHAVGVEELSGGLGSEVIAIDLDRLSDPLHASLEPRRGRDGRKQDKRVGHRAEGVPVRAAPDPEARSALPRQERGIFFSSLGLESPAARGE